MPFGFLKNMIAVDVEARSYKYITYSCTHTCTNLQYQVKHTNTYKLQHYVIHMQHQITHKHTTPGHMHGRMHTHILSHARTHARTHAHTHTRTHTTPGHTHNTIYLIAVHSGLYTVHQPPTASSVRPVPAALSISSPLFPPCTSYPILSPPP